MGDTKRTVDQQMEREQYVSRLPVKITIEEKGLFASELTDKMTALDEAELEKKRIVDEQKEKIARVQKEINRLRNVVATGKEERPVNCERIYDLDHAVIRSVRLDTGEEFHVRPMEMWERQKYLDLTIEEPEGEDSEDDSEDLF